MDDPQTTAEVGFLGRAEPAELNGAGLIDLSDISLPDLVSVADNALGHSLLRLLENAQSSDPTVAAHGQSP